MADNKNKMAKKKTSSSRAASTAGRKTKTSGSKTSAGAKKRNALRKTAADAKPTRHESFSSQFAPYMIGVLAIFISICIYAGDGAGIVGEAIKKFLLGMNGATAFSLPLFILVHLLRFKRDKESGVIVGRVISTFGTYALISALLHIWTSGIHEIFSPEHWNAAQRLNGGGVVGGAIGESMLRLFGKAGALLLIFAALIVSTLYIFNVTPLGLYAIISDKLEKRRDRRYELRLEKEEERRRSAKPEEERIYRQSEKEYEVNKDSIRITVSDPRRYKIKRRSNFETDVDIDEETGEVIEPKEISESSVEPLDGKSSGSSDADGLIDEKIFDEVMKRTQARRARENAQKSENNDEAEIPEALEKNMEAILPIETEAKEPDDDLPDLEKIFVNPDDADLLDRLAQAYLAPTEKKGPEEGDREKIDAIEIERTGIDGTPTVSSSSNEEKEKPRAREYILPPISILTEDTELRDTNIKEELHNNAVKLVETLRSFNVRTKIENVSRGPTITRYELLPEAGIRVRSIVNLVDDISLGLATTGVRIEAPIPGKAAVGIEVPNKKRATVHLRTLLEMDKFSDSGSKTICALGEDVGGEPIYLDIAKMPHLLIAGATGMGKSVCINSLIVSLLYNAKPDDVKLILIDPKKVELNIYNGIPHLLVPVVSDPKKAAGSLSWAVSEMERRFGLIESVGVRDVNMFNKVTANDPEYEFLPYIVIIIDELADLMMTAPDDVEDSICRLMQKARAAGMHVIIGTQRPSVDVITGLIKANIPSRIAFTVASQVDSRTIIDRSGAENLIGRGDMLYIPVGASKPIRVQGAFVSEEDVEKVVAFIKDVNQAEAEYSDEVIAQIDKEAEKCGSGKKGGGSAAVSGGEEDPMLRSALELAVNSGKISTSLIQRRLSLGYGRAAKLIDRLEQLGYVSEPEGQKPREVLITKEQFMEMTMKDEDTAG